MEAGEFEPYYEIVFGIARGASQLITGLALAMLCRHFFADRKAARRVWWVGAAYLVVVLLFLYVPFNMYAFAVYLLCFSSAYLTLCCLEKENSRVWFFLCFTFFTIRWLSVSVSQNLCFFIEMRMEGWMMMNLEISPERMRQILFFSFTFFRILECALFILILSVVCKGIVKLFFFNRSGMRRKELFLLMIPSLMGILCYIWTGRSVKVVLEETNLYIDDMDPMYRPMEFGMQVLLLAAVMAMLYLYQKLKQEQGKTQSDRLLLQEMRSMRAHIEEVERLHEDLRGMRHDMRNHISVLKRLLERGELTQAKDYLDSMGRACTGQPAGEKESTEGGQPGNEEECAEGGQPENEKECAEGGQPGNDKESAEGGKPGNGKESAEGGQPENDKEGTKRGRQARNGEQSGVEPESGAGSVKTDDTKPGRKLLAEEIRTGNPVTDVILAEYQRRIKAAGAVFQSDFHYPDDTAADAFDLSIILDNALTNALEALPQHGVICIRSFRERHAYLIVVENTFEGVLAAKGAEGLPMTTKQPAEAHGFGLRHIKAVAEHYHGAVTIEQEGSLVRLNVMLCI